MRRYWEIYRIMLRNSLIREMNFKANFLLWMLVELLWFVGQIVFLEVLFSHVDEIGGWTKWQVVLLVGTHQIIGQIFQAFFYANISNIPELVRTGRMDFLLLQPLDSQFAVSSRQFGLDSLINSLVGFIIVGWSLHKLGITPSAWQFGIYCAALLLGVAIHYSIMFALAAVSFWIVRAQGLLHGYYSLFNIARYPDGVFRGVFRAVFSWLIPVIIVANTPARVLVDFVSAPARLSHLALAAALVVFLTRLFWSRALMRYSSASS